MRIPSRSQRYVCTFGKTRATFIHSTDREGDSFTAKQEMSTSSKKKKKKLPENRECLRKTKRTKRSGIFPQAR